MTREIQLRDGFKVVEGHASCPVGKPWGVVRADGSLHPDCGCHPTLKAALKHMAEFYAAEKDKPRAGLQMARVGEAAGREFRASRQVEFRVVSEAERTATIRVCTYNTVDDFGSIWVPGVWAAGLKAKLPKGTWAHDWTDIIGRAVDYDDTDVELLLMTKFSDFDAVPRARQAWTQLRDGDVDEFSFGFERRRWEIVSQDAGTMGTADNGEPDGMDDIPNGCRERITEAIMHEWSPVLVGAVPGTGVLAGSVRSRPWITLRSTGSERKLDEDFVVNLAVQMKAGEIDLLDALTQIREAVNGGVLAPSPAEPKEPDKPAEPTTEPSGEAPVAPVSAVTAEMTEELLKTVAAQAEAAKAGAEQAATAEADALILAADVVLDGMGRSGRGAEIRSAVGYVVRAATAAHDTPVVDKPWDGPGVTASMPNDAATLKYCHAWQDTSDGADPAAKSSYKLPHHMTKGGPAIVVGVRNALSRLPQTKGIPAGDMAGVLKHLQSHLDKFNAK